jgi:hypothetical protein
MLKRVEGPIERVPGRRNCHYYQNSSEEQTMLNIKLSLLILLFSMTMTFSAAQQQTEAASKVLALENKWNEAYKQGDIATLNPLLQMISSA